MFTEAHYQLRSSTRRMFYIGRLPLQLSKNPYYVKSYTFIANHKINGFVLTVYNTLRIQLLDESRTH